MIKLFFAFAKVSLLTQMEHRATYIVRTLSKIISFGGSFALLAIMLVRFKAIGSWSTYEVLMLYALNMFSYSIGATFAMPINNLSIRIRNGAVDSILTKPINPMFLYICQYISAGYTGNYVLSITVMIICLIRLETQITVFKIIYLCFSILGGALIHAAALIASGVAGFWLIKSRALTNIFYNEASRFVDYPLNIYSKPIQFILTFVLPYGFISYYPTHVFLSKADVLFHPALAFLTPIVGVVCFTLAYKFWKLGLKSYQSTGS